MTPAASDAAMDRELRDALIHQKGQPRVTHAASASERTDTDLARKAGAKAWRDSADRGGNPYAAPAWRVAWFRGYDEAAAIDDSLRTNAP